MWKLLRDPKKDPKSSHGYGYSSSGDERDRGSSEDRSNELCVRIILNHLRYLFIVTYFFNLPFNTISVHKVPPIFINKVNNPFFEAILEPYLSHNCTRNFLCSTLNSHQK